MRDDEYRRIFDSEERFWWYEGMRAVTASFLDGRLKSNPGVRLLDVGCGTGYSIAWTSAAEQSYLRSQTLGSSVSAVAS